MVRSRRVLSVVGLAVVIVGSAAAATPTSEMIGTWHYQIDSDAMTDAPRYTAYVKADESDARSAVVLLMCPKPKHIQVGVRLQSFIGNKRGMRDFIYRFDDKSAVTGRWNYLGGQVVGKDLGDKESGFLSDLAHATRLRVRAMKTDGTEVNADFALGAPAPAIARLAADCKLDPVP
jgi:hypothetical protein